jgi:hypothetical protein
LNIRISRRYKQCERGECIVDVNSIMASQLRSLQSTVRMSVLNNALTMNTAAATDMLKSLSDQPVATHPHKGISIDVKA